ncbi:hypothetical protein EZV62_019262 [Acer yangbiense]|uniref:Reverse transcriptase zinc-binding domain-containing protein n=1 Tax=Acer yangbiense TaxID=1000413 RepID=A0A5C7HCV1_9ROSI|nr:hypothetical protein EZV62_019262 [Acer yangbiense]
MKADSSNRGSHLWRSLCWGRGLLEKGTRWRIGTGSVVAIYSDQWVLRPNTFKVFSPQHQQEGRHIVLAFYEGWGFYSKDQSGYKLDLALDESQSTSNLKLSGFCWKLLWGLCLPSKIKIFLWKASYFFFYCSGNLGKKELELLCVLLWWVWYLRNQVVHGGGKYDVENAVSWAGDFLADFYEANLVLVT